jgi:NADH dehydrogenase
MGDKILVIGGGFAGFWAAVAARRVAGDTAAVTLVSPAPMLEIRPRLYEAKPETLAVDMLPHLRKADIGFVRDAAIELDAGAKIVTLASGERMAYDRLVVATGSRMKRPPVPGADAAFSVDTQAEAVAFDRRLAAIARAVPRPTIAAIGAGFTGIELALELRDRLKRHGAGEAAERAHRAARSGRDDRAGARARTKTGDRGGAGGGEDRAASRRFDRRLGGQRCPLRR